MEKKITDVWDGKVREVIITRPDLETVFTKKILRERIATPREIALYKRGYGRLIQY